LALRETRSSTEKRALSGYKAKNGSCGVENGASAHNPKNGSCGVENGASAQNRFGF
jgi:hypothetical protein